MTTARIHQAIAATAFFCFAGALRLEALHFLTLLSILAARKILFFSSSLAEGEKRTGKKGKPTAERIGNTHAATEMGLRGKHDKYGAEDHGGSGDSPPQGEIHTRTDTLKRKTSDSDLSASGMPPADADNKGTIVPRSKRRRLKTTNGDNGIADAADDHGNHIDSGIDCRGRVTVRRQKRHAPTLIDPSEGMVAECDCVDLPLVRRWMRRKHKRFEVARYDSVWWQRATSALRPMPTEAGGGLLLVSVILRGHPFAASYEDLVKDVPDNVLGAIAWRGTRLIFGLCVHPDGCGPIASRPEGTPAHPHADRVLRLALTLPPDHEDRDTDGNPVFTVGQVVHTISNLCGGNMAGRRLARFARLLARWYDNAYAHWGEARESIECFIERRVLLTARTGCTAADLTAGRLRPCDWLSGAPGPTIDMRQPLDANSDRRDHDRGDDDDRDDDKRGDKDVISSDMVEQQPDGNGNIQCGEDRNNKGICIDDNADDAVSIQDRAAAEYKSDLQEAQRRRREIPSLRCVYDRLVCKQPQAGRGLPCLYIQSRLCAAEDRPDA